MFWRMLGIVAVHLALIAWVVAGVQWGERMLSEVNKIREPGNRLSGGSMSPLNGYRVAAALREFDSSRYWKAQIGFGIVGLCLLALLGWLFSGVIPDEMSSIR